MKVLLMTLISILKEEIAFHHKLLEYAKQKELSIINNDINVLQDLTRKEEEAILKIKDKEDERIAVIKDLARYFEVTMKELTMAKLISLIDGDVSFEFKKMHKEIVDLIEQLKIVNDRNNALIKTSLDLISYSMNLYVNLASDDAGYGEKGTLKKNIRKNVIFDKTV